MSRKDPTLTASAIATRSPIMAYPDQSIHDAVLQLGGRDIGRIPVRSVIGLIVAYWNYSSHHNTMVSDMERVAR